MYKFWLLLYNITSKLNLYAFNKMYKLFQKKENNNE